MFFGYGSYPNTFGAFEFLFVFVGSFFDMSSFFWINASWKLINSRNPDPRPFDYGSYLQHWRKGELYNSFVFTIIYCVRFFKSNQMCQYFLMSK